MKGQILSIEKNFCGYILGDDKNKYYFDCRFLNKYTSFQDLSVNECVEFTPTPSKGWNYGTATNIKLLLPELATYKDVIQFYTPGFARHIDTNRELIFSQFLKVGSKEDVILEKLSKILYITKIGHHIIDQSSIYQFCLIGATEIFKQYIRGQYEFLLIFSHFNERNWQQKSLIVEREIRKRREIYDRRPLVNFYIMVSNANNLKEEIDKIKGSTTAAVIPFSFEEIIDCKSDNDLIDIFLTRFHEYLYENDMLGETNAIDDDNLLFGDRGKIADSIVARCQQKNNSGIFGLRRSGKTSVLNAVLRRLERDNIKYIKIESRSELESLDSWNTALYYIAQKVRQATLGIDQAKSENRDDFKSRLQLNSTEKDYEKRASQFFVEDIKIYCKNCSTLVIAIDEIELITYNTAKFELWKNVETYCGFWGALRDSGCPIIVSGVNSTINEINTINYNGKTGDNPMYGRITNCADSIKTYLPAFSDEQTKVMINTLGSYSNIAFTDVYAIINRAFGGQPYAVRQFCSYVFNKIKKYRIHGKLYEVSRATVDHLLIQFNNSAEGNRLCEIILQHLTIFNDEYNVLKKIALSPEIYQKFEYNDISKIDHLEKYGLIEYDRTTFYVTFNIESIRDYIKKYDEKDPLDMSNDERRIYVQNKVVECEIKLKTYIRNYFTLTGQTSAGRKMFQGYLSNQKVKIDINKKANPCPDPKTCTFGDFFDHKLFILYFSSIKTIINDKWSLLGNSFTSIEISRNKFCSCMDDLNAGRNDADHYDAEDTTKYPNGWNIDDSTILAFSVAYNTFKKFFDSNSL
ncbi:hypothetical protein EDD70_0098 [Hydrogenoanaerobacterium saccharovorans]|uniref:Uncharacterized protein n=1 Tax=Hydrogenoanaerobacterium saccharovorans TaxID=474960 RepID=A0A1H8BPM1_9FIRM|nr:hypothetical protein [Hydrogenoanaerobacterium saccharovorans]RPF47328.1 hypothetical protein EDD70_0098 [Hydrogenoanaerobacterium saccharovorans]SEM84074.1 hypothetical protein SAMN05216180_1997 [Hydrogenoanaerobacterium saccharovorans]